MVAIIVALAVLAAPAFAQDAPKLLFHADFDGDLTAQVAAGEAEPQLLRRAEGDDEVLEEIERAQGVFGEAVVTAEEYVRYPGGANLNPDAGTVEVWVKPIDWTGDDELFHVFFNTNNQNPGWLILYKYFQTEADTGISRKMSFYVGADPGEERLHGVMVPGVRIDWQPGTWHHIAGVWERRRAALYIDGAMVAERTGGAVPTADFTQLNFGQPWGSPGPKTTAIDEARIYDAPLSAEAIRASFARGLARLAEHSPDQMPRSSAVVKSLGFPAQERVAVYVSAAGAAGDADQMTGRLSVVPRGETEAAHVQTLPPFDASRELFAWLDTGEIEPGNYELRVTITAPDMEPLMATTECTIPARPDWWENDLGMTDEILPPYEPIETAGLVISPWGRDYVFSDALILRRLTAHPDPNAQISELAERFHQTTNLLAAPIAVAGTINGEPVRVETGQPRIVDSADNTVRLTSTAREAGIDFSTQMLLEYDGIMQVSLTIDPDGARDLRDMRIEIPMPNDLVTLMNYNSVDGFKLNCYAGEAPSGDGVVWEDSWLPLIWLGDEYRGLCWFNDRYDGWSGDVMEQGRVQLVREGDVATLRLNFATVLDGRDEPITLNFCLAGTPTRPMPEGWRGLVRDGVMTRPETRSTGRW
ncbi:MAG: glycoside hydrolase domain-containing protein, partial [Armatimonadota bacterium]